jgi:prepilin peptidase CpaA
MRIGYTEWMAVILICAALVASWNDYRRHRVPNWLNAAVLGTGLATQSLFSGWTGLQHAFVGVLVGFAPLMLLWLMKAMGAGDVKFMAAVGAWLGPRLTLSALVFGGLAGGVMALGMIALQRNWRQATANMGMLLAKANGLQTPLAASDAIPALGPSKVRLPYAVPLSLGTLVVVLSEYFGWWRVL